ASTTPRHCPLRRRPARPQAGRRLPPPRRVLPGLPPSCPRSIAPTLPEAVSGKQGQAADSLSRVTPYSVRVSTQGGVMADLLLGQVLSFTADPFVEGPGAARHIADGAVLVDGGHIIAVGEAAALKAAHPQAARHDYGSALISAGFVDAHVHYPQTAIIASWGKRLIDWLNGYTFPEEMRFADPAYAAEIANRYLDLTLAHGTTTVCSYAT